MAPQRSPLIPLTALLLPTAGTLCLIVALFMTASASAALAIFGSTLFLASGGFVGEAVLMHVRTRAEPWRPPPRPTTKPTKPWLIAEMGRAQYQRLTGVLTGVDWVGAWSPVAIAIAGSLIAGIVALAMWSAAASGMTPPPQQPLLGCVFIVMAFPLLVLDRVYARLTDEQYPAAAQLEHLLRLPVVASAGLGISGVLRSLGYEWPFLIDRALIVLTSVIALEIVLRSIGRIFLPTPPVAERRSSATSGIAGLLAPRLPRPGAIGAGIQRQFGVDLSRSWALAFLTRAFVPVLVGLAVFGWLLSSLTALGINQRAVYERFGTPVAIEGPGLHVHLPWPFGIMRKVELGVVHEIPIVFQAGNTGTATTDASTTLPDIPAEAVPPASADRLWDNSHPFEASYLIASAPNGQQGFQIVNIDLRIVYRASLSAEGATAAAYHIADPAALIRAAAGRMLVQHFSRYTLADVLGESRARFVSSFRTQLQQRLDQLQAGTDIIAVVVEAIHPPPAAARAYHNVQAAQIRAEALVSQSRGAAFVSLGKAQQVSTATRDAAQGGAAEQVEQAQVARTLFQGDERAYRRSGQVFLMEQWLGHLDRDLKHSPLVIVDHRLNGASTPTIDLRRFVQSDVPPPIAPKN